MAVIEHSPLLRYALPQDAEERAVKLTLVDRHTKAVVFSRLVSGHAGEEAMSTVSEAAHDLCVKSVGDAAGPFRPDLEVERGHGAGYYAHLAGENHMDRLQVEIVKLNDELAEVADLWNDDNWRQPWRSGGWRS